MAIPANKDELRSDILLSYTKLRKELEAIPPETASIVSLSGHTKDTKMSVHNLASYLLGWGELVLKWHKKKGGGEPVDFPERGFKWNELGKLAQKFYADYQHIPYEHLLLRFDGVVEEILALIDALSNDELYGVPWYERYTMGRMIQLNTSSPYKNARLRIRKWKSEVKHASLK